MKKKYYAVKNGKKVGIFETWDECKEQVNGYSGAEYKSFSSLEDAEIFLGLKEEKEVNPKQIIAYVDGSYNDISEEYGSGVVIMFNGETIEMSEKGSDKEMASMRNVAGEVVGATLAMDWCEENIKKSAGFVLTIYYDYTGIENWALANWKTNKEGTRKYKERAQDFMKSYVLRFVKVKAHSGDRYNDRADQLAKQAVGIDLPC